MLIKNRRIAKSQSSPEAEAGEVIRVQPADDLAAIAVRLAGAARVEINFPKFGDGRGYSIARLLRDRYGYKGELRATGQVARDLLLYMEACGFDSFELREGEDAEEALTGFGDFSDAYQGTVPRPLPLFRRRT
ncbi:MAG TPA: DUF934 domain-containing protein [Burkholderiales bacterium]|nr:DUF934 domain-containing protein [Burkholderiales bacterium]